MVKPAAGSADTVHMGGRVTALAFAMEATDAYDHTVANLAVVDEAIRGLGDRVPVQPEQLYELTERLHALLHTNRTAPSIVRIMAYANAARVTEADAAESGRSWFERRALRREATRFRSELRAQLASTLDALAAEPY